MPSVLRGSRDRSPPTAHARLGAALGVPAHTVAEERHLLLDDADLGPGTAPARTLGELLPPVVRGGRLRLEPRAVVVLVVLALGAVLVAGWYAWQARATTPVPTPTVRSVGSVVAATPVPPGSSATPSGTPTELVVDVAGRVRRPGLVRLAPGSRVADAVAAAGGALPGVDLSTLNLARLVSDGEQVLVGIAGASTPGGGQPAAGAGASTIDLNTATVDQLDSLPGVGQVLAQRIVDWRTAHGRFTSVDQLGQVGGIGPTT